MALEESVSFLEAGAHPSTHGGHRFTIFCRNVAGYSRVPISAQLVQRYHYCVLHSRRSCSSMCLSTQRPCSASAFLQQLKSRAQRESTPEETPINLCVLRKLGSVHRQQPCCTCTLVTLVENATAFSSAGIDRTITLPSNATLQPSPQVRKNMTTISPTKTADMHARLSRYILRWLLDPT